MILRNATETCPLLEKSALHEPKIFLKMARIARHPPSKKTILLWIVVVTISLILFGIGICRGRPAAIPARLAELFAFSQNHDQRGKNCEVSGVAETIKKPLP